MKLAFFLCSIDVGVLVTGANARQPLLALNALTTRNTVGGVGLLEQTNALLHVIDRSVSIVDTASTATSTASTVCLLDCTQCSNGGRQSELRETRPIERNVDKRERRPIAGAKARAERESARMTLGIGRFKIINCSGLGIDRKVSTGPKIDIDKLVRNEAQTGDLRHKACHDLRQGIAVIFRTLRNIDINRTRTALGRAQLRNVGAVVLVGNGELGVFVEIVHVLNHMAVNVR